MAGCSGGTEESFPRHTQGLDLLFQGWITQKKKKNSLQHKEYYTSKNSLLKEVEVNFRKKLLYNLNGIKRNMGYTKEN